MIREHRWTVVDPPPQHTVEELAKAINVPEKIAHILIHRGITNYEEAKKFFRPQLTDLHDPFLMMGMTEAVDRVLQAIDRKEKILIFGDYDVDGTTSVAMLYLYFTQLGNEVITHIPDRIKEGYGISIMGIDKGKEFGATVLIAIDCGISAIEQVEYARTQGIDVIICDHHEPGEQIPNAVAVLDTFQPSDKYPFKFLCGCGVGFKLLQAVERTRKKEIIAENFVDLITLATTADIVPLTGENRIITKIGLQKINTEPRPGLRAIIESSGLKLGKISTGQIVFVLAPRINAVGRMGDATRAVKLLTSTDYTVAHELAQILEEENRNRRKVDEDTFSKAQQLVETLLEVDSDPAIVLHHEEWHPGVIGIVASRLVEKYYRPTIMMTTVDGIAKGSARSIVGFDIHKALKRVESKLLQFGGHKYAAGLAVALDRIDEFREAFNEVVQEMMPEKIRMPELRIDTEISLSELNPRFLRILREFAPYGPGNMRPIFLTRNVEILGTPKIVGKDHLKIKLREGQTVFDAIGFGLGSLLEKVKTNGNGLDIVFSVDEHEFAPAGGTGAVPLPQLKIKDIRKSGETNHIVTENTEKE
jgi:single-stranded-DNA-specific exonuclease